MYQLSFEFMTARGQTACKAAECRSCKAVGKWKHADCGLCRKAERRTHKQRYWAASGFDHNGKRKNP